MQGSFGRYLEVDLTMRTVGNYEIPKEGNLGSTIVFLQVTGPVEV